MPSIAVEPKYASLGENLLKAEEKLHPVFQKQLTALNAIPLQDRKEKGVPEAGATADADRIIALNKWIEANPANGRQRPPKLQAFLDVGVEQYDAKKPRDAALKEFTDHVTSAFPDITVNSASPKGEPTITLSRNGKEFLITKDTLAADHDLKILKNEKLWKAKPIKIDIVETPVAETKAVEKIETETKVAKSEAKAAESLWEKFSNLHLGVKTVIFGGTAVIGGYITYKLLKEKKPEIEQQAGPQR